MPWDTTGPNLVGICDFEYDLKLPHISPQSHLVGKLFYPADARKYNSYPTVKWLSDFAYTHAFIKFLLYRQSYAKSVLIGIIASFMHLLGSSYKLRGRRAPPIKPQNITPVSRSKQTTQFDNGDNSNVNANDISKKDFNKICDFSNNDRDKSFNGFVDVNGNTDDHVNQNYENNDKDRSDNNNIVDANGISIINDNTSYGTDDEKFPVIVFSHGLGGNRNAYSFFCSEMASYGYVVVAIEHADTSACMTKLAGKRGKLYYDGFGDAEKRHQRLRYRVGEMATAIKVLQIMNSEGESEYLRLCDVKQKGMFRGRLDLNKIAAIGHSYGGATVAEAGVSNQEYKAIVCLDPYFPVLPPNSNVLNEWKYPVPMMILGSEGFNTPNKKGQIIAGTEQQPQIIQLGQKHKGIVFCVPEGSIHNNFDDSIVLLNNSKFSSKLMRSFGFHTKLDPVEALRIMFDCSRSFIDNRLRKNIDVILKDEVNIYQQILGERVFKLEVHTV
eukprot:TRINITY_DN3560_c1_g1_i1.p1 TRINITY_DN3560_c1_g1~~TRINITY_DN3560_c1_g1_i1.p1  ORF type:complete len:498 (+),score=38.24 TRINITY_DN3560_c1_g1_i1:120-1613(+)